MTIQGSIHLLAPPGDTANNAENWYELAVYLNQATGLRIKPQLTNSFTEFSKQASHADIIYAGADQLTGLMRNHLFRPLAQPINYFEEAVIVAGPTATGKQLQGLNGNTVGGIRGSFANRLGLTCLKQKAITPSQQYFSENWLKLTRSLRQGEISYAILSRSYLEQLSDLSRSELCLLARTNSQKAFPLMLHSPTIQHNVAQLRSALVRMTADQKGQTILTKLNIDGWQQPQQQAIIKMLKML